MWVLNIGPMVRVAPACGVLIGIKPRRHVRTQSTLFEYVVQTPKEASTALHEMSVAGAGRACWLFRDAVCETAAVAATTICEGVTTATNRPTIATIM